MSNSNSDSSRRRSLPLRAHDASEPADAPDALAQALAYHQRTKHQLDRYARSPGYLDWANQPKPFRTYQGVKRIELPLPADGIPSTYDQLYELPSTVGPLTLQVTLQSIAALLELALGLSAWKEYRGSRWALRCNPSSGNLHPTEGYVLLPHTGQQEAGVYHYDSHAHCLEQRCRLGPAGVAELVHILPADSLVVGLASIHWREAWKYGERAFRYCQHDAGHALATVRYAAAALGWSALLLDAPADEEVATLLGLDRSEDFAGVDGLDREHPIGLVLVSTRPITSPPRRLPVSLVREGLWTGQANRLSAAHVHWEVIEAVAAATSQPMQAGPEPIAPASAPGTTLPPQPLLPGCHALAATLIRQRRSCLALDGQTPLALNRFYRMLDVLLPRPGVPPWDVLPWQPHLHPGIFVHRVTGLASGLYLLERDASVHDRLRAALRPTFLWQRPASCPEHLRLYCLQQGDYRGTSQAVSCHQEIASDGAFTLGMLADFLPVLQRRGAWWYRRLFWEAGILGQVLYLEAEAASVSSTGIGCYFDDSFHDLLGLTSMEFQDLYHFTVGTPVEDKRLLTKPPYAHLHRALTEG